MERLDLVVEPAAEAPELAFYQKQHANARQKQLTSNKVINILSHELR